MTQTLPPSSPPSAALRSAGRSVKLRQWLDLAGPAIALVLIFLLFVFLVPDWSDKSRTVTEHLTRFANFENITNILRQSCMTAVAALGMTFIIISGGIDLSTGSLAAFTGVIIAVVMRSGGGMDAHLTAHPVFWPLLAAAAAVFFAVAWGALNGAVIAGLRIVPFIVTLGTMMIIRGNAKGFAHETNVPNSGNWLWDLMGNLGPKTQWMLFPPAIWITLILAILMAIILSYSRFGRQVIAVGSNEQTARLCGIQVGRIKVLVYMLGGLFTGIAGLFFYSRITQGDPTSADAFELDVIAAVVIGGASLNGGKGSIFGSCVGALILNVIARGCSQIHIPDFLQRDLPSIFQTSTGLPTYVQQVVTGVIIISAAVIDRFRQRPRN